QAQQPNRGTEEDTTSELQIVEPSGYGIRFDRVVGLIRKATNMKHDSCATVPLSKEMRDGIHSVTVRFENGGGSGYVGIMKASCVIRYPCKPDAEPCVTFVF
ncbi:MAG: hypothetical protein EZS28_054206, partial [Streblomastix strix]